MEIIGVYPLNNFGGIEILEVDYDAWKVVYKITGNPTIYEADIIDKNDGEYIDALGFMYGDTFIPFHDIMKV